MEFTQLEREILQWIADKSDCPELVHQIKNAKPSAREFTGVGSYTDFEGISDAAKAEVPDKYINGPTITSPDLMKPGAMSILFFKEGRPAFLEIATYDGTFPETLTTWILTESLFS